jgi:hypothetical protein
MLSENGQANYSSLKKTLFLAVCVVGFATAQATTIGEAELQQLTNLQKAVNLTTDLSHLSADQTAAIFKVVINVIGLNVIGLNTQAEPGKKATTDHNASASANNDQAKHTHTTYLAFLTTCLNKGLNPNVIYQGSSTLTPLHHAAFLGEPEVVALLLAHKANYQAVDAKGKKAIWYADPVTHAEELKDLEPKWSLVIPFIGTAMAYSAYVYWLHHQQCYELLKVAEDPYWHTAASLKELDAFKHTLRSRIPQAV